MKLTGVDTRTDRDAARAERAEQQHAQQAQIRILAEHHAALAREFHALHEQDQAEQRNQDVSPADRRVQRDTLVRTEGEVLAQAQRVRDTFQRLLSEQCRHPS